MDNEERVAVRDVTGTVGDKKLAYTKSFTVDYTDPETGDRLAGTFTCKRPSLGDIGQLGVVKARLNGGEQIDRGIDFIHEMMAYCQVTLTDVPKWWTPSEFYDEELLVTVYKHVRSFQDSFRDRRMAGRRNAAQVDRGAEPGRGVAPAVVVPEVQPTA